MKQIHNCKSLKFHRWVLVLIGAWVAPVSAYNSEEHKLLGDWAASEVRLDTTIQLPDPTRLSPLPSSASMNAYAAAKNFAVGFATNTQSQFDENKKKVQDNSYPPGALLRATRRQSESVDSAGRPASRFRVAGGWPYSRERQQGLHLR